MTTSPICSGCRQNHSLSHLPERNAGSGYRDVQSLEEDGFTEFPPVPSLGTTLAEEAAEKVPYFPPSS